MSLWVNFLRIPNKLPCLVLFFPPSGSTFPVSTKKKTQQESQTKVAKRSSNLSETPVATRQLKLDLAGTGLEVEN